MKSETYISILVYTIRLLIRKVVGNDTVHTDHEYTTTKAIKALHHLNSPKYINTSTCTTADSSRTSRVSSSEKSPVDFNLRMVRRPMTDSPCPCISSEQTTEHHNSSLSVRHRVRSAAKRRTARRWPGSQAAARSTVCSSSQMRNRHAGQNVLTPNA